MFENDFGEVFKEVTMAIKSILRQLALIIFVSIFLIAGCQQINNNEEILGVWISEDCYWHFNMDGTYQTIIKRNNNFIEFGTFAFDGNTLTLNSSIDSVNCPNIPGHYEVKITENEADFDLIEDECLYRKWDLLVQNIRKDSP
jgi:hypothetical protein